MMLISNSNQLKIGGREANLRAASTPGQPEQLTLRESQKPGWRIPFRGSHPKDARQGFIPEIRRKSHKRHVLWDSKVLRTVRRCSIPWTYCGIGIRILAYQCQAHCRTKRGGSPASAGITQTPKSCLILEHHPHRQVQDVLFGSFRQRFGEVFLKASCACMSR